LSAAIPARYFWSVTVYDAKIRSLLENGRLNPSICIYDQIEQNPDGSIDIYFGPNAPKGKEKNWIKTLPGAWLVHLHPPVRTA
jgi:hypothetical protein